MDGLIVGANDAVLGLGFNDAVISYTVLATVGGRVVDVDAAEKMRGRNVPRDPTGVWTEATRVVKHGPAGERLVARGDQVETMVVGLPDERFYGKAIAGGVILTSWLGDPAGCLVCDHLLVTTRLDAGRAPPLRAGGVALCRPWRGRDHRGLGLPAGRRVVRRRQSFADPE